MFATNWTSNNTDHYACICHNVKIESKVNWNINADGIYSSIQKSDHSLYIRVSNAIFFTRHRWYRLDYLACFLLVMVA